MANPKQVGEAVLTLRNQLGLTQAQVADKIGSSQSRMSEWEAGANLPSTEMLLKLADLAYGIEAPLSVFFLRQTAIAPEVFISAADSYMRLGEADVSLLLSSAEMVLNERRGDQKSLEAEGRAALVPPLAKGERGSDQSAESLILNAEDAPNAASCFYLVAPTWGRGVVPGDRIAFDATGASTRKFHPFLGLDVVIGFEGLHIGRLDVHSLHGQWGIGLGPRGTAGGSVRWEDVIRIDIFTPLKDIHHHIAQQIRGGTRLADFRNPVEATKEEELFRRALPEDCEILGRLLDLRPAARRSDAKP